MPSFPHAWDALLLDNCEHLVEEAAPAVQQLLESLRSQNARHKPAVEVPGEILWRIPALALPEASDAEDPTVASFDAVQLFHERAAARKSGYEMSGRTAAAVEAAICRRLDGMPLAIDIASTWVGVLAESDILQRVTTDLSLLEHRAGLLPERHRSITAAIEWSYKLLDDQSRRASSSRLGFRSRNQVAAWLTGGR